MKKHFFPQETLDFSDMYKTTLSKIINIKMFKLKHMYIRQGLQNKNAK